MGFAAIREPRTRLEALRQNVVCPFHSLKQCVLLRGVEQTWMARSLMTTPSSVVPWRSFEAVAECGTDITLAELARVTGTSPNPRRCASLATSSLVGC